MWAVSRADVGKNGGTQQGQKFPQKVTVWLGASFMDIMLLMILDEGTVDHAIYIKKVLPAALKYRNQVYGSDWVFQQDRVWPQSHHLTQQWYRDNFPSFIDNDR